MAAYSALKEFRRSIVAGDGRHGPGHGRVRPDGVGEYLLQMTTGGACRWVTQRGEFLAGPGDLTLLEPHSPQHVHTHGRLWRVISVFFSPRPHWGPWLDWPTVGDGLRHLASAKTPARQHIQRALQRAIQCNWHGPQPQDDFALAALEEALLWTRTINPGADGKLDGRPDDVRVQRAVQFIRSQVRQNIGVGDVADAAGVSRTHLFNLFHRELGQTPQVFIEANRIELAKQFLQFSDMPVARIADAVGFNNPFYFSNRFRRRTGLSPREYRVKHQS